MKKLLFILPFLLLACKSQEPCIDIEYAHNLKVMNEQQIEYITRLIDDNINLKQQVDSLTNCPKSIIYIPIKDTCR